MPWTNKKAGNSIDHQRGFIQLQVRGQDVYQDYSLLHQWSRKSSWIILATFWSLYKSILQLFKPNMYEEEFPKATRTQKYSKSIRMEEGFWDGRSAMAGNVKLRMNCGIQLYPRWVKCVNMEVWRSKIQYSTDPRWRKEGREALRRKLPRCQRCLSTGCPIFPSM